MDKLIDFFVLVLISVGVICIGFGIYMLFISDKPNKLLYCQCSTQVVEKIETYK